MSAEREAKSFEERVTTAITSYEAEVLEAIKEKAKLPPLSISAFTRRYKISRSQLYRSYPKVLNQIEQAFIRINEIKGRGDNNQTRKSKQALASELASVRREFKSALQAVQSCMMTDIILRFGPAFRSNMQLLAERSEHLRQIDDLRRQVENQQTIIQQLMSQLNS